MKTLSRGLTRGLNRLGTGVGAAAAAPTANLLAGYSPSTLTSFTDAGGTVAGGNGSSIYTQAMGGGTAGPLQQATAGRRPVLTANGAGKWFLRFDGVDDGIGLASVATAVPVTYGLRFRANRSNSLDTLATFFGDNFEIRQGNPGFYEFYNGTHLSPDTLAVDASWHTLVVTWNGASSEIRYDGAVYATGDSGSNAGTAFCLGSYDNAGTRAGQYDVAGWWIYGAALPLAQKQQLETYLATLA